MSYKYFTPEFIEESVREVERQLDERKRKEYEDARLARLRDYMANPANAAAIASDPLVRALRSLPAADKGANPAPIAPAPPAQPVQRIGFSNAAIDPYVGRRIS
jgi:hypothetical protein